MSAKEGPVNLQAHRKWTPGPWNLVWWGNETYPYPLSILADNDGMWIARDGTVSSEANARLITAAPDLFEALTVARAFIAGTDDGDRYDIIPIIDAALAKVEPPST